jgi:hypothetical protein
VQFSGENIHCIEYHDFAGQCRAIGNNPARAMLATAFVAGIGSAMMAPAGSGRSSGHSEADIRDAHDASRQCADNGAYC